MSGKSEIRQEIIERSQAMIFSHNNHLVTLDEIACAIDIPAETIKKLIGKKEDLFALIVRSYTQSIKTKIFSVSSAGKSTQEFLQAHAENYLRCVCKRDSVKMFQFAAGLAPEFPHISAQFRSTAREGASQFAEILEKETTITAPEGMTYLDASSQFYSLCRGAFHHQLIFDIEYIVGEQEIVAQARKAVSSFLRAFSPA